MLERLDELPLTEACNIVATACAHADLVRAVRQLLETLVKDKGPNRSAAARAIRRFIDARVRARRIPASEAENIASDIEMKMLVRPELFLAARNPAAYIAMSIRNRWYTHLRTQERERRRAMRQAEESLASEDDADAQDSLSAELVLRQAREDLDVVASYVVARAGDEVREQQKETWTELVDLAQKRLTMNDVLRKHQGESDAPEHTLTAASKALRDRVLQRHQRMRNRMGIVVKELASDPAHPDWTQHRADRAMLALRQLFCRCQRKPLAASSPGGR